MSKGSEKRREPMKRSEGKVQENKNYPNKEISREGWKENQENIKTCKKEESISTKTYKAIPYAICDISHSPKLSCYY